MVLDEAGGFEGPRDIAVNDSVVTQVGRNLRTEGESVDFGGLWVLPGMVDCHLHAIATSLDTMEMLRTPLSERVLDAASVLRRSLEAGVTYARDAGGIDAGVRNAVRRGFIPGPDLQVVVGALSQTGGHFDGYLAGPAVSITTGYQVPDYPGRPALVVDGTEEVRKSVRQLLRSGADWIKLCTTGGIMSGTGAASQFTREEIMVAASEARRRGKPTMVHCFGGDGLNDSLDAGVRSIEHGLLLTEEQAHRMATNGCWLVPTLTILRDIQQWASAGKVAPSAAARVAEVVPRWGDAVRIAKAAGVKIALGTDFITREQHGTNLREIASAADAGLRIEEALLAATRNGAELLGVGDRYGRIAPGYVFDAIVLDEDPSDLSFAREGRIAGVFKAGRTVVEHPRLARSPVAS
jgi:imidazolonepropionase-like amidohydrolase